MEARDKIIKAFKDNLGKHDLPSCGDSLFQCDWYAEAALSVLNDICKEFNIYEEGQEDAE